jgi:hypothetical protein
MNEPTSDELVRAVNLLAGFAGNFAPEDEARRVVALPDEVIDGHDEYVGRCRYVALWLVEHADAVTRRVEYIANEAPDGAWHDVGRADSRVWLPAGEEARVNAPCERCTAAPRRDDDEWCDACTTAAEVAQLERLDRQDAARAFHASHDCDERTCPESVREPGLVRPGGWQYRAVGAAQVGHVGVMRSTDPD